MCALLSWISTSLHNPILFKEGEYNMVKNTVIAAISAVMMPLALAWGLIAVLATAEQLAAISTE